MASILFSEGISSTLLVSQAVSKSTMVAVGAAIVSFLSVTPVGPKRRSNCDPQVRLTIIPTRHADPEE